LWAIFSGIFMCAPIRHFWDSRVPGKCLDKLAINYSAAGVNASTDFATAILPLPLVSSLPISRQQKILLMVVFGFGFWLVALSTSNNRFPLTCISTCIVSVLRLVWLYPISITKDVTYESPLSALWSNVELNVGVLCSCVPTLRSCMARLFPSLFIHIASSSETQPETEPSSTASEFKRMTIQEIAIPQIEPDLEQQRPNNNNDLRKQPFSFIACTTHNSSEAVRLTTPRSPPTTSLSKIHTHKASLPNRVARWHEGQRQKATAPAQQEFQQQQQQQQRYPNNDSMKNLLSEHNEATLSLPEQALTFEKWPLKPCMYA
jgi:hypothetical protein